MMLEAIQEDACTRNTVSNQPIFSNDLDYENALIKKKNVKEEWMKLSPDEKRKLSLGEFEKNKGVIDLKDPSLNFSRNTYLLMSEIKARVERDDPLVLLPIEPLDFEDSTLELAESLENVDEIRSIYRIRKATVGVSENSGISRDEAFKLKNFFSQGRELFISGKNGSLMVKPLNFFYSITAYAYGIIILNNPLRYRKDMLPGSHGMSYLPQTIQAQFGGDCARGTFSDLVGAFPTHIVMTHGLSFNIDCSESIKDYYNIRFDTSLGTLISLIPEMSDYYKLTTGKNSRCYPLEISRTNDHRKVNWVFQIGNGESRPSIESIENAFCGFEKSERHGKIIIDVPGANLSSIKAAIYTDIRGKLWFIDNVFHPIILPEIAVHFLISSIFSNIMRYRPDEWGNVLLNEVSSNISLLTRHYFSSLQRKFMLLILRSASRYVPYAER